MDRELVTDQVWCRPYIIGQSASCHHVVMLQLACASTYHGAMLQASMCCWAGGTANSPSFALGTLAISTTRVRREQSELLAHALLARWPYAVMLQCFEIIQRS
jgi:hypothetical protein